MESERANKEPPTSRKQKAAAFSPAKEQAQENCTPKDLVGRIIEKGFPSSPPSWNPQMSSVTYFPQPTVLSFPVARHRSHGPHWSPLQAALELKEDDLANDIDETDYAPISTFAGPIERKEKKGLDFSRWREFISCDNSNSNALQPNKIDTKPAEEKKKILSTSFSTCIDEASTDSLVTVKRAKCSCNGVYENGEPRMHFPENNGLNLASGKEKLSINGREAHMLLKGSTMDDIYAENSARLNQMSLQEIVDAQSEIIQKMNPAKVEMLKKRGQGKLGNRKFSASKQENGGQDVSRGHLLEISKDVGNDNAGSSLPPNDFNVSEREAMHTNRVSARQVKDNCWKNWSERVGKVRELRFSLEGDFLEVDSHQVSSGCDYGDVPPCVGNVAERDFLRMEGDPAALGYSIKEVIELIRSMVPAQRALALKLLDSILNKALLNLLNPKDGIKTDNLSNHVDWQAIWAYALGPEPQIALSLRIALDDNHNSVVLACAKVIQSILSCDMNENFFNVTERLPTAQKILCTAPIFRRKSELDTGFLQGGYWKYSTKPSNILPPSVDNEYEDEEKHTIQDDVVVAGQDILAGLVRMGILPRICYLLEMEPIPTLVECLVSVLIGLARHSPTCANAVIRCPSLVQNVVNILTGQGMMELPCQIKAVTMLKVLSQMDKHFCSNFVKGGIFQQVMWHWYRSPITIDHWMNSGMEHCKLTAALMVEQFRLWKVCISYGYCVSYFADFFPHMCLWLSRPAFNRLLELNVLEEFAHITREAYLTLGALAKLLPRLHSMDQLKKQRIEPVDDGLESWSWSHVVPLVNFAINWLTLKDIPYVSLVIHSTELNSTHSSSASSMIWVISAVLHMLYCIFDRLSSRSADDENDCTILPWLPEFVPKVGIEIVKNKFFSFNGSSDIGFKYTDGYSLVRGLCNFNLQENFDVSLSSLSCLHGLILLTSSVDQCIRRARNACDIELLTGRSSELDDKILVEGMLKCAKEDLTIVLNIFGNLVSYEWPMVQSTETFGRGGPAPGVGVGWGSPAGGIWSLKILWIQTAARLVLELLKIFPIVHDRDLTSVEAMKPALQRVNYILAICLVAGPGDRFILEKALRILLQPLLLKCLGLFLHHFLHLDNKLKSFKWQYEENDYFIFSKILNSHFRERWLSAKLKSSGDMAKHSQSHSFPSKSAVLDTIHEAYENQEASEFSSVDTLSSFCMQWAYHRLPVPMHWFLSAICGIGELKYSDANSLNKLDIAKCGLFLLLCLEALSSLIFSNQESPVLNVSYVWKLHALSMSLHATMAVLEDVKARDVFESLQEFYGKQLDVMRHKKKNQEFQRSPIFLSRNNDNPSVLLSFQAQVNEGYSTFVENLIEQFGAVSYGDIIFGRQVAIYLHRTVDIPIRLATWNALSNAHLLELLPPLELCISEAEGYLEPPEDNEGILEAYAKSWTSGFLDRAFIRGSVGFSLAVHHLYAFIFASTDKQKLRNKLASSILRCYSHKADNNGMLLRLVQYKLPMSQGPLHSTEILQRFELLKATCGGNSSLIEVVERLESAL